MRVGTFLLAASATALLASPAYSACQDQVTELEQQIQEMDLTDMQAEKMEDKLAEARNALANNNENQCADVVAAIETDLETEMAPADERGTDLGGEESTIAMNWEQPEIKTTQEEPEVTIRQTKPEVEVQRTGEADITYEGYDESDQQAAQADLTGAKESVIEEEWAMDEEAKRLAETTPAAGQPDRTVGEVKGQVARTTEGQKLGRIENIVRDATSGEAYVVISSGGFLGFGSKETAIPFSRLEAGTEDMTLDLTGKAELDTYDRYESGKYIPVEEDLALAELQLQ